MKVFILNMVTIFLFQVGAFADPPTPLRQIRKPYQIQVSGDQLFISEDAAVYCYRFENPIYRESSIRFEKKFGFEGEGPRAFKLNPFRAYVYMFLKDDEGERDIIINSVGRVSVYDLNGEFKNEYKVNPFSVFSPIRDRFVGTITSMDKKQGRIAIGLFNEKFIPQKILYSTDQTIGSDFQANLVLDKIILPYEAFIYRVQGNKVYIPCEENNNLIIKSFDSRGNEDESMEIPYEKERVTGTYKKKMMDWLKNRSPFRDFWEKIRHEVIFKSYFPMVKNMLVDNGRIYVITYRESEEGNECIVLEKNNHRYDEKRILLDLPEVEPFASYCYTVKDNYLYALHENEETETWELRRDQLDEKMANAETVRGVPVTAYEENRSKSSSSSSAAAINAN